MPGAQSLSPEQVERILDVSRLLAVTSELDPLLTRIAEAATTILGCERASIFLHDIKTGELWTKVALQSDEIRVPANTGIVGQTFSTNQVVDVPNPYEDARFNRDIDKRLGFVTRNLLAAPMIDIGGRPLGVLQALNKKIGAFSGDDRSLIQLLADQAGVAIQRYRLQVAAMEIVALRREMELARVVQDAMIPKTAPHIPGISAAGKMLAASITGGDCFDFWKTADGRLGIFLGDACGHGIAPTLVVSQARTLVRTLADSESDPGKILGRVNTRFGSDLELGKFVTAFLGFLSPQGDLEWCSAGHGPVLIRRSRSAEFEHIMPSTPPLAVVPDLIDLPVSRFRIEPGGMLAIPSDGISEALNPLGETFGGERVTRLLGESADTHPEETISRIFAAVADWEKRHEPADDQTMVLVRMGPGLLESGGRA